MIIVRPLQPDDRTGWDALWDGYCRFYRAALDPAVTDASFDRLCAGDAMVGLLAVDAHGRPVGLAHAVFHPSTWARQGYCYLEDLFVAPAARGGDAGRALIEQVYAIADGRGAERVYWHTQEYNGAARSLYDALAHRTSFVVYTR